MAVITIACMLFAFAAADVWLRERARRSPGSCHTFLVDPPTFFLVALLACIAGLFTRKGRKLTWEAFSRRRKAIDRGLVLFLLGFWTFELLTYFDVLGHPFDPSRSGNDFMINGYVEWLTGPIYSGPFPIYHEWWSWPLLVAMLALQYGAMRLGRAVGYMTAYFNDMDRWTKPQG